MEATNEVVRSTFDKKALSSTNVCNCMDVCDFHQILFARLLGDKQN